LLPLGFRLVVTPPGRIDKISVLIARDLAIRQGFSTPGGLIDKTPDM